MPPDSHTAKSSPTCPSCGNRLRVRADQMGEQLSCPKCKATFILGQPAKPKARPRPTQNLAPAPGKTVGLPADDTRPAIPGGTEADAGDDDAYEPEIPLVNFSIVPREEMSDLTPPARANRNTMSIGASRTIWSASRCTRV